MKKNEKEVSNKMKKILNDKRKEKVLEFCVEIV